MCGDFCAVFTRPCSSYSPLQFLLTLEDWRALLEDPTFGTTAVSGIHDSVLSDGPYFFDPDLGVGLYNCTLQVALVFQRSDL